MAALALDPQRAYHSEPPHRLPTQTFHPSRALPFLGGQGSLTNSAIGGAHFGGVDPVKERRLSRTMSDRRTSLQQAHAPESTLGHHRRLSVIHQNERPLTAAEVHAGVLADLRELFECRPTPDIFERRFARNAIFEDPFVLCRGVHEVAPFFFSLAHVYARSTTLALRVLSLPEERDCVIFAQKQEYVLRITGIKKIVDSVVVVELDEVGRITRIVDQWRGKPPPTHWGASKLRRAHARLLPLVPWLASAPPSPTRE